MKRVFKSVLNSIYESQERKAKKMLEHRMFID
ncbi:hypothetical protein SAMN05518683_10845 [Salibacterium halotolerans]|uniref:Uncharacterized protein n=1 Tax=Salibacterium halotolerans TaxID=1884432 RepID=A0A1I5S4T2_9BACI|nr:hypothetical protein SAMN05518683_10845 [Salibacterium halotolerans]